MKTRQKSKMEESGSDSEAFEMPETVICLDTICNICYAEFIDEDDLKLHYNQVHLTQQSRSRYCPFCSTIFTSVEDYAAHLCNVHISMLKCCRYCMRAFSHVPDVTKHERKHFRGRCKTAFCCSNCDSTFQSISQLEDHDYMEHKDSKDGMILRDCYSLLSSFLNINVLKFLQNLDNEYVFTCAICKLSTSEVDYYMQHLQEKNCRSLACDKCFNVYKNTKSLIKHFLSHPECCNGHDILKKPCPRCYKMFNFNVLYQHIRDCNAIKCMSCNLIFDSIVERTEHQIEFHKMKFSIETCRYCHKEFVGQVALDKHVDRLHKKELHLYKYFCVYCDEIFNHPRKLFSHFYSKHKDLKPFTCQICNKTFRIRKHFTLHIKMEHSCVGTVKFDNKFHVFFTNEETSAETPSKACPTNDESEQSDDQLDTTTAETQKTSGNTKSLLEPIKEKIVKMSNNVDLVMYPTETDVEQTDVDIKKTKPLTRKRKYMTKTKGTPTKGYLNKNSDDTSCEEPLIKLKKQPKTKDVKKLGFKTSTKKSKEIEKNRQKFTCKVCNKYCYTYQNYNHHMTLHVTKGNKKCIKCSKVFKSKDKLIKHIREEHTSSKLTETLKTVLERRKNGQSIPNNDQNQNVIERQAITEKFLRTIKKVNIERNSVMATVTPVVDKLSAKKFIENFTPETNVLKKNQGLKIDNSVTIKPIMAPINKPPLIKLTKYKQDIQPTSIKLRPPEKFKNSFTEKYDVSIKLLQQPYTKPKMNFDPPEPKENINKDDYNYEELEMVDTYYDADEGETTIPDVAQEVMLEETQDTPKPKNFMHKIVIPNMPKQYKNVHIAHLLPEAPYYKIVKIDEVLKGEKVTKPEKKPEETIKLPDGLKLVNVNPLAHLLGDKQLEIPKTKYYKPKLVDFEKAIAKALTISNKTVPKKKSKVKVEQ